MKNGRKTHLIRRLVSFAEGFDGLGEMFAVFIRLQQLQHGLFQFIDFVGLLEIDGDAVECEF